MIRTLTLAGALAGAVSLSQFPEFSQQYLQRLSGAVDELRGLVLAFDATAGAAGPAAGAAASAGASPLAQRRPRLYWARG